MLEFPFAGRLAVAFQYCYFIFVTDVEQSSLPIRGDEIASGRNGSEAIGDLSSARLLELEVLRGVKRNNSVRDVKSS